MENLAYLYALAEEAEHPATNDADPTTLNTAKRQRSQQPMLLEPQAAHSQPWLDSDCDRANQSYPTFYL